MDKELVDDVVIIKGKAEEEEDRIIGALISTPITLAVLDADFYADNVIMSKLDHLMEKYETIRKVRPDCNTFFRAFGFSYFEYLTKNKDDYDAFKQIVINSKEKLVKLGFPEATVEDLQENLLEVIEQVKPSESDPYITESGADLKQELYRVFTEQLHASDYLVILLRFITSGHLQERADSYSELIDGNLTMAEFCHQEVEPMYKEADHIHILALCSALNIGVRVEYPVEDKDLFHKDFPDGTEPKLFLLFRPSHYDILYPKN